MLRLYLLERQIAAFDRPERIQCHHNFRPQHYLFLRDKINLHGLRKNTKNDEVSISNRSELTFALEDGVPGVPPGIIGVEGVPVKKRKEITANGEKRFIFFTILIRRVILSITRVTSFTNNVLTTSRFSCLSANNRSASLTYYRVTIVL